MDKKMNIVVIVRTRDEAERIGKFCESYKDADTIIVSDGGSLDDTESIASQYSNVILKPFFGRTKLKNGYWRNNDAAHANFLINEAKKLGPDWIIYDDCDCLPNKLLKQDYREILGNIEQDFVHVTRIYVWGNNQHFPDMSKPGVDHKDYEPSLWAWRGGLDFWMVDVPPAYTFRIGDLDVKDLHFDASALDILPPYCLIHYSWDNEEKTNRKVSLYSESGLIPGMLHPLEFAGHLENLPEWAYP